MDCQQQHTSMKSLLLMLVCLLPSPQASGECSLLSDHLSEVLVNTVLESQQH